MLRTLIKTAIIFVTLSLLVTFGGDRLGWQFGEGNYWEHHGVFFLIFLGAFPRLTLLFSEVLSGGLLWWLSFIFAPRILVATLATLAYWKANPGLVVGAWIVALGGESTEKRLIIHRTRTGSFRGGFDRAKWVKSETIQ